MAKTKRAYVCNDCGADFPRWQGQCSACGAWNTITEVRLAASPQVARNEKYAGYAGSAEGAVQTLQDINLQEVPRLSSGFKELDRVLGGGIVPGAAILIGGNPGAGKSTLLLQTMVGWRNTYRHCISPGKNRSNKLQCVLTDLDWRKTSSNSCLKRGLKPFVRLQKKSSLRSW